MILVTGATGFVGPKVVHALRAAGHDVRALVRDRAPRRGRSRPGAPSSPQGDVTDPDSLRAAAAGADTVVHLVAIRQGRQEQFQRVMVQGTRNLSPRRRRPASRRFVLMSALGTDESTKDLVPYYGAKWQKEQDVQASGIPHVIFRPSFVFGSDGGILPTFVRLAKLTPATPIVGSGDQRIQPIWVDDVAAYFAKAVDLDAATNRVFELGGPGRGQLERALGAAEARARPAPPELPRPDRADAPERARHRAPARERPADARPAEDARGAATTSPRTPTRSRPSSCRSSRSTSNSAARLDRDGCRLAPWEAWV